MSNTPPIQSALHHSPVGVLLLSFGYVVEPSHLRAISKGGASNSPKRRPQLTRMNGALFRCVVQRFGVVADAIARGLGYDTTKAVENCRKMNMFLDDFECCQAACGEAC